MTVWRKFGKPLTFAGGFSALLFALLAGSLVAQQGQSPQASDEAKVMRQSVIGSGYPPEYRAVIEGYFQQLATADALEADQAAEAENIFRPNDRVVFLGNTFAERLGLYGHFETLLSLRLPQHKLTFRNMGWSGDTPALQPRPLNFNFGDLHSQLTEQKADVIFLCFGMNESFEGEAGLEKYKRDLATFIDSLRARKYNGEEPPRLVLVSPIAHENLGGDLPDPAEHNSQLAMYTQAMREVAKEKEVKFIDLYEPTRTVFAAVERNEGALSSDWDHFTINGIHLNELGDWLVARELLKQLDMPCEPLRIELPKDFASVKEFRQIMPSTRLVTAPPLLQFRLHPSQSGANIVIVQNNEGPRINPADFAHSTHIDGYPDEQLETLRQAIVERNLQFFNRWRAVNGEYIYGRRKEPFGVHNFPGEMKKFDEIIADLDAQIHKQVEALGENIEVRVKLVPAEK